MRWNLFWGLVVGFWCVSSPASASSLSALETDSTSLEWSVEKPPTIRCRALDEKGTFLPSVKAVWRFSRLQPKQALQPLQFPRTPGEWEVACERKSGTEVVRDMTPLSVIVHPPTPTRLTLSISSPKRWIRTGTKVHLKAMLLDAKGNPQPLRRYRVRVRPAGALLLQRFPFVVPGRSGNIQISLVVPRWKKQPLVSRVSLSVDGRAPTIQWKSPQKRAVLTVGQRFEVKGWVRDSQSGIRGLWWKGLPVSLSGTGGFQWSAVCQKEGQWSLFLLARDKVGNEHLARRTVFCQKPGAIPWKARQWRIENALVVRLHQSWLDSGKGREDLASVVAKTLSTINFNKLHPSPLATGVAPLPFFGKTRFVVRRRGKIKVGKWKVQLKTWVDGLAATIQLKELEIPLSIRLGFVRQKPLLRAQSMFVTLKLRFDNKKGKTDVSVESFFIDLSQLKILQLSSGYRLMEKTFAQSLRKTATEQMGRALRDRLPQLFRSVLKKYIFKQVFSLPSQQPPGPRLLAGLQLQQLLVRPEGIAAYVSVLFGQPSPKGRPTSQPATIPVVRLTPPAVRWEKASFDVLVSRDLLNLSMRTLWKSRWMEREWNLLLKSQKQWVPGNLPFYPLLRRFQIQIQPQFPPRLEAGSTTESLRLLWEGLELKILLPLPTGANVQLSYRLHLEGELRLVFGKSYKQLKLRTRLLDFHLESGEVKGSKAPLPQQLAKVVTQVVWQTVPQLLSPVLQQSVRTVIPLSPWLSKLPFKIPAMTLQPAGMDLQTSFLWTRWKVKTQRKK